VLVKNGFTVANPQAAAAAALASGTTASAGKASVRKGMDLVRVGNLGTSGVAFFFDRVAMPPPPMLTAWVVEQVVPALVEVCAVFQYDARCDVHYGHRDAHLDHSELTKLNC